jgi:hypothetical protein
MASHTAVSAEQAHLRPSFAKVRTQELAVGESLLILLGRGLGH